MIALISIFLLASLAGARVTFTHSEVLQESDLDRNNIARFKCDNGCRVYSDSRSNDLMITEYDDQTKAYEVIEHFSKIGGNIAALPTPYLLKASKSYFIENRGDQALIFVFYAVDNNAPNLDTPVMVIADDQILEASGADRLFTVLSSRYGALRYTQFEGDSPEGYPRIYSTGFDAVAEEACPPMFQARSHATALLSTITVLSPIATVDYGAAGGHNVRVRWNKDGAVTVSGDSSSVYSSPGYVGCSYNKGQIYSSSIDSLKATFSVFSSSLDANLRMHLPFDEDEVHLKINEDKWDLSGLVSYTKHYDAPSYDVSLEWKKASLDASFALQLDFGLGPDKWSVGTTPIDSKVTMTTSARNEGESTTSQSASLTLLTSCFITLTVVFMTL